MTLQTELKITKDELTILQAIVKTHPYFPELALDDFIFKAKETSYDKQEIKNLLKLKYINIKDGTVNLTKAFAKEYWNDLINSIEADVLICNSQLTKEILVTKSMESLKKAYNLLTGKSPVGISKQNLITEILKFYEPQEEKMVKEVKENKKEVKKEAAEKTGLTPKEAAEKTGIQPSALRKILRKLYGKTEGTWSLTDEQVKEVAAKYKADKEETAKNRSERMAKLQEARKAKAAQKK